MEFFFFFEKTFIRAKIKRVCDWSNSLVQLSGRGPWFATSRYGFALCCKVEYIRILLFSNLGKVMQRLTIFVSSVSLSCDLNMTDNSFMSALKARITNNQLVSPINQCASRPVWEFAASDSGASLRVGTGIFEGGGGCWEKDIEGDALEMGQNVSIYSRKKEKNGSIIEWASKWVEMNRHWVLTRLVFSTAGFLLWKKKQQKMTLNMMYWKCWS